MREVKTIKLSECEVDVFTYLTWGEKEKMQQVFLSGAKMNAGGLESVDFSKMYEAKIRLMELAIVEVREGEKKSKFSKEWVENLSIEDGDKIYAELELLNKKKV